MNYSPWPAEGKWFRLERNYGVVVDAKPFYGDYKLSELESISLMVGKHWFLSFRCPWFHFYLGAKPITLEDPQFYWRSYWEVMEYRQDGFEFYQQSARFGFGEVS